MQSEMSALVEQLLAERSRADERQREAAERLDAAEKRAAGATSAQGVLVREVEYLELRVQAWRPPYIGHHPTPTTLPPHSRPHDPMQYLES